MRPEKNTCIRMRGFSLVELLVAITLGAIILAGAVTLFVNNQDTYKTTNELSRLQETARYALGMMVKDIRMAGYYGCADRLDTVTDNTGAAAGDLWNPANPIEGWEGDVAGNYLPSNVAGVPAVPGPSTGLGSFVDNVTDNPGTTDGDDGWVLALGGIVPDSITLRYLAGNMNDAVGAAGTLDNQVTADAINGANSTITVDSTTGFALNQVAAITDCGGSDIFQINTAPTATTVQANALSRGYNAVSSPMIAPFVAVRYYIGANGRSPDPVNAPYPSLYRAIITPGGLAETPQELFEGVESLQLLYGEDTDADGTPDNYANADAVGNWASVVSVRLSILVRTIDEHGRADVANIDTNTYQVNNIVFDPVDDRRRRRVFTTTAMVRNL
ncbi:MAG: PilW family protein [Gammaproteobacteria bacterium]|nr:PilW family protein [Gammaproteobacteria bacterium]